MKRPALLLALLAYAAAGAQTVSTTKFTLDNGMTFILHEDHSAPVVTLNTWFYVGSKDEAAGRSGFAHLFEHLMFMGTNRAPGSQFDQIMEAGGGSNNASTSQDRTNYYSTGPSSQLPTLLWLEADRIEDLGKAMTQKKLDLQRQVVLNERRETENSPYGKADIKINELLYPVGHPYHFNTIGLPEDLNAATVQDVKRFFATYYVPNNATMVIAGDFEPAAVRPLIDRLFGSLPRRDDPARGSAPEPRLPGVLRHTMVDQVQYPRITMAWHSPAYFQPGDAELDIAAGILASGISSRLYQRLIYQDKLATDVAAYQASEKLGSVFVLQVTVRDSKVLAQAEKATDEVLAEFVQSGPTQEELQRQLAQLEYAKLNQLQSVEAIADQLNEYQYYLGEPDSFKWDLDRYRNATTESVRAAVSKTLDPNRRLVLTVLPSPQPAKANPRDSRPKDLKLRAWAPPAPTEMALSNGIKVLYWQRPSLPLMALVTLLPRGSELDPIAKEGVSALVSEMLSQGAGGKGATEFSKALERLGANFSASVTQESTLVSLSSTESSFADALPLYADALIRPNFDPGEWDRVKRLHEESVAETLTDPNSVARRVANLAFFGKGHPYGRPMDGTLASLKAATLEDVKSLHSNVYTPAAAVIFAAGSMRPDRLRAELDKALGSWSSGRPLPAKPNYTMPKRQPLRVVLVERPGAVQTVIRFVMPAPTAKDRNRIQLQAIGTLLGGTFTSRLMQNLREAKGYTYGAFAAFAMQPSVGVLVSAADVQTNVTGASLTEFLKEFRSIRAGNITAEEVGKAKNSMRTELVQSASTLGSTLAAAVAMHLEGRPYTALGQDLELIASLSPAQLNALAKSSIPLENAVLVLVGDKAQILAQWKGLGLPLPVTVKAE